MGWQWALGIICVATIATQAVAEDNCSDRETVIDRLQARYGETLAMGGLQATQHSDAMMEVWASQATGTFTVLLTSPDGVSCIVAAGTDFFNVVPHVPVAQGTSG